VNCRNPPPLPAGDWLMRCDGIFLEPMFEYPELFLEFMFEGPMLLVRPEFAVPYEPLLLLGGVSGRYAPRFPF
jgi:hypothetical protein